MNQPKHTPGPWSKDKLGRIWRRHPSDLYEYGGGVAGDEPIATVLRGWYGEEEGYPVEANARLIAAAPELLEALKKALDALGGNDPHDLGYEDSICAYIRAVIAKAEGTK